MWRRVKTPMHVVMKIAIAIVLLSSSTYLTAQAQGSVATYNQFALQTDELKTGETCTGPSDSQANMFITAKNKGWIYAGFLYSGFLTTLDQYQAAHGTSNAYSWPSGGALINTSSIFSLSACDYSYCLLKRIFGNMPNLFYAQGAPICPDDGATEIGIGPKVFNELFQLFNVGMTTVVCLMVAYGLIGKGVITGGFEGDILQKNFTMATAFRSTAAVLSIIPIPGIGYSALQTFIMYIVLLGVSFADSTFRIGLDAYLTYGAVFSFSGLGASNVSKDSGNIDFTLTNVQNLFNTSSMPSGAKYASIMNMISCATYNVLKSEIEDFSGYNSSIPNDAISSLDIQGVSFEDIIAIDDTSSSSTVTISFGDQSDSSTSSSCGSITWVVPSGQTASSFTSTPAYFMLQSLYRQTASIFKQTTDFYLSGVKTTTEDTYYNCLSGLNTMFEGLVSFTSINSKLLWRPSGIICQYDSSTTERQTVIESMVNKVAPYASSNQIAWKSGCSEDCLGDFVEGLIDAVGSVISTGTSSLEKEMSSTDLQPFSFSNKDSLTDPTDWVINTGNNEFNQVYIGDLLVLTQVYKQLAWELTENVALENIYKRLVSSSQTTSGSFGTGTLSSSMNMTSLNSMTQSLLAPFFGSNAVDFLQMKGYILTWRNLAVSASNFTTSLMMIVQRLIGFYYYDPSSVMTMSWYSGEGKNDNPSAWETCKSAYQTACMGNDIDNCYSSLNSQGCFMNSDGVGRGLLGSAALMYDVGTTEQDSKLVIYNPLADYIEIGYTILTASTYYLFQNNMEIIALYLELAGVNFAANTVINGAKALVFLMAGPDLLPWAPKYIKFLMLTAFETAEMGVNIATQIDQDRIGFYNNIGTTFMVMFIPFGAILTILLPLYPTIIFIVGIFGWIASVLEALIAGPMIAVGLCHPEGGDFLGKAEMGIGLLFQTFLRPVLIIMGVFLSISVINLSFYAFNIAYATQYANLAGGTSSPLGSAMSGFDNWQINVAIILALVMLYAYIAWELVAYCCVSMISFSNQVLAWVSSGSDSRFASTIDILAATKSQMQSDYGSISSGLKSGSERTSSFGGEARQIGASTAEKLPSQLDKGNRGFVREDEIDEKTKKKTGKKKDWSVAKDQFGKRKAPKGGLGQISKHVSDFVSYPIKTPVSLATRERMLDEDQKEHKQMVDTSLDRLHINYQKACDSSEGNIFTRFGSRLRLASTEASNPMQYGRMLFGATMKRADFQRNRPYQDEGYRQERDRLGRKILSRRQNTPGGDG